MAKRSTVVIPVNLGAANWFDRSIFPMSLSKSVALARGELFLQATVEEVLDIASMCANLGQSNDFAKTTQLRRTELMQEKIRLENRTTTRNPFKELAHYRAVKIFYKTTKSLYVETKTTSELMKHEARTASVEGEEGKPRERSTCRVAYDHCTPRNDEGSPRTRHGPLPPLTCPSEPASTLRKEEQPVNEDVPTIRGIVASDVDPDKVPELEKVIADAFRVLTSNANAPTMKKFIKQLSTAESLHLVMEDGAADPAASRASQAPTENETSDHSTASPTPSPTTSCSTHYSIKVIFKDTIIAPNAIITGTSLSQGHSHSSGPVRHDVTIPPPPESA